MPEKELKPVKDEVLGWIDKVDRVLAEVSISSKATRTLVETTETTKIIQIQADGTRDMILHQRIEQIR